MDAEPLILDTPVPKLVVDLDLVNYLASAAPCPDTDPKPAPNLSKDPTPDEDN